MTGMSSKNILWDIAMGLVVVVILWMTGLLDAPLTDALPWGIALGILLGLLFRFVEDYLRRRTSKRQETP